MCFREFKLKFILACLLLVFPLFARAECSPSERQTISKMFPKPISVGSLFDKNNECTVFIEDSWEGAKRQITYLYNGESSFFKMIPHGIEIQWHDLKNKKSERYNDYGKIHGMFTTWHSNGQKKSESIYINNLPHGIETIWSEKGEKISENVYRNGMIVKAGVVNNSAKSNSDNSQIEIAKQKCLKLGFKEKTEKFGICVLEFIN